MTARYSTVARLNALRERVTEGPGKLPSAMRRAAASGAPVPDAARDYTDKVRRNAHKVVERDIADLRAAGWSEDEIFELTLAAAMGAGLSRLNYACRMLEEATE